MKVSSRRLWQLNVCSAVGLSDCRYGFYFTCLRQRARNIFYFRRWFSLSLSLSLQVIHVAGCLAPPCFSFPRSFPLARAAAVPLCTVESRPCKAKYIRDRTASKPVPRVNSVESIFKSNQFSPLKLTIHIGLHLNGPLRARFTNSFGYRLASSSFLFPIEHLSLHPGIRSLIQETSHLAVPALLSTSCLPSLDPVPTLFLIATKILIQSTSIAINYATPCVYVRQFFRISSSFKQNGQLQHATFDKQTITRIHGQFLLLKASFSYQDFFNQILFPNHEYIVLVIKNLYLLRYHLQIQRPNTEKRF